MAGAAPKLGSWAAWALAVGGMIGGGIYTLAGVILGVAGPLAWVSLVGGAVVALATVRSYRALTRDVARDGVPLTFLLQHGHRHVASVLAWWLLLVYVLALAVYAFTFARYVTGALGAAPWVASVLVFAVVGLIAGVNLRGVREPAAVQVGAVIVELTVLAAIAVLGFWWWDPANVASGVPAGSFRGVVTGAAATFIAFEGFEMLAYDLRDVRGPRRVLDIVLPAAVLAVALAYATVTVGAASLVGAGELVAQKEHALALAGGRVAGTPGVIVVSLAACASAASAINATLFSVSRLARSAAEARLLPLTLACENRRGCPSYATVTIAALAAVLAASTSLEPLIQAASLAFLALFAYVNVLAWRTDGSAVSFGGAAGATVGALIVGRELALEHPLTLGLFGMGWVVALGGHAFLEARHRARGVVPPEEPPGAVLCDLTPEGCGPEEELPAT